MCAPFQKLPIFYGYQYDPDFEIVSTSGCSALSIFSFTLHLVSYHNLNF